jgi:flavin-dependent dehydrogenase
MTHYDYDVTIIGAGPSGSIAAALLCRKGYRVCVVERQIFPRFSIGESLLAQSMVFIEEAGMTEAVHRMSFQRKDGAAFRYRGRKEEFDFHDKSAEGPAETFQVIRAVFDKTLIDEAERQGAQVYYDTAVESGEFAPDGAMLTLSREIEGKRTIRSHFCLDASGYGRVLPRLLDLDVPSRFPPRVAFFTHITDRIDASDFNRDRILITVHPERKNVWYWLIPFSNGTASVGVVGESAYFAEKDATAAENKDILRDALSQDTDLHRLLANADFPNPVGRIEGYSSSVKRLYGDSFALLGNAGEFLDPIFSSGVTIAMKSASLAAKMIDRQFSGLETNWQRDYADELMIGVNTFRAFVESWYDGDLIDIFFSEVEKDHAVRRYFSSILAGYAWDANNPYTAHSSRRLKSLANLCR